MPHTVSEPHGSYITQSLEHATVSDAMHPGILSCEPDASVTEVAKMMVTHHVHCVAVIGISRHEPECFVWGIVSDLDLVRAGISDRGGDSARALAGQPILVVEPTTTLDVAGVLAWGEA